MLSNIRNRSNVRFSSYSLHYQKWANNRSEKNETELTPLTTCLFKQLVYVNYGTVEDFAELEKLNISVAGKICITR